MKTKKLRNLITKAKAGLSWPIREESLPFGIYWVSSDFRKKEHGIFKTVYDSAWTPGRELALLHELGHALLCEQVHPVFATYFPVSGIDDVSFTAAAPALNAASDWFVGHWLMEFCRDVAMDDLKQEYETTVETLEKEPTPTPEDFYVAALIIAQSKRYLKEPVDCGGILGVAVEAFQSFSPEKPSARSYELLANRLLELSSSWRCRLADVESQAVLDFYTSTDKEQGGITTSRDRG